MLESISTPKAHRDQPTPLDRFDEPTSPPLLPTLTDAILNLKVDDDDDDDAGQQKDETDKEDEVVVENETLNGGDKESAAKEIVKDDGWSDDGFGRVDGGVDHGNGSYKVDGWEDVQQPECKEGVDVQQVQYPLRPGAEDCNFYMRMGSCKFGFNCKFNHPPRTRNQVLWDCYSIVCL